MAIEQGAIYAHDFGPRKNHLQEGPRPVVVIQRDELNKLEGYSNVIIVPLTTKGRKSMTYVEVAPSDANRLTATSWAITNQIFTIDQGELTELMGRVSKEELYQIKQAILFVIAAQHP